MTASFRVPFTNSHFTVISHVSFDNCKMNNAKSLKIVNCEMKNAAPEGDAQ